MATSAEVFADRRNSSSDPFFRRTPNPFVLVIALWSPSLNKVTSETTPERSERTDNTVAYSSQPKVAVQVPMLTPSVLHTPLQVSSFVSRALRIVRPSLLITPPLVRPRFAPLAVTTSHTTSSVLRSHVRAPPQKAVNLRRNRPDVPTKSGHDSNSYTEITDNLFSRVRNGVHGPLGAKRVDHQCSTIPLTNLISTNDHRFTKPMTTPGQPASLDSPP